MTDRPQYRSSHLYVNVVQFMDGSWGFTWFPKWLGSRYMHEAIAMRRDMQAMLIKANPRHWKPRRFRTIKIV